MTLSNTIGFIGYGNMAQALAQGLVRSQILDAGHIVACAAHFDKLQKNASILGVRPFATAQEVCQASDVLIVAVKPYQIEEVLKPLVPTIVERKICVISLAAGWWFDSYQALLGSQVHLQCIIPNTPIAVGQGVTLAEKTHSLTDEQLQIFNSLFEPISLIERVSAEHMHIAMCLSSCAPAFTAMYMEALADAGVKYGLTRPVAYRLAAKMIQGVGALYMHNREHPGMMKDAVCSPSGTTIQGVAALEYRGFRGDVIAAIDAIEQ